MEWQAMFDQGSNQPSSQSTAGFTPVLKMIIDPADRLPEPLTPLQQEYQEYCQREQKAGRKPDPIMRWAKDMHIAGSFDPLNPDLEPVPFEETAGYDELGH